MSEIPELYFYRLEEAINRPNQNDSYYDLIDDYVLSFANKFL